jgi:hypothetical protein
VIWKAKALLSPEPPPPFLPASQAGASQDSPSRVDTVHHEDLDGTLLGLFKRRCVPGRGDAGDAGVTRPLRGLSRAGRARRGTAYVWDVTDVGY